MTPEVLEALAAVLRATPEPPKADAEPADVLHAAREMLVAREGPMKTLEKMLGDQPQTSEEGRAILVEIQERSARWQGALERARRLIGQRVGSIRQLRTRGK